LPNIAQGAPSDPEIELAEVVEDIIPEPIINPEEWRYKNDIASQTTYDFVRHITGSDVLWDRAIEDGDQEA
jgi:hypothetical protein